MPSFMTLRLQTAEINADKQIDRQRNKQTMYFISMDRKKKCFVFISREVIMQAILFMSKTSTMPFTYYPVEWSTPAVKVS